MQSSIADRFVCSCCGGQFPEEERLHDNQLGPVCPACHVIIRQLVVPNLAKNGMDRPVNQDDLTLTNKKRLLS